MTREQAVHKIELLANVSESRGFTPAEAEAAAEMRRRLIEQFAIDVAITLKPASRFSWQPWEQLCDEFGLRLSRLGKRGSTWIVDRQHLVTIKADSSEWMAHRVDAGRKTTVAKGVGIASLWSYFSSSVMRPCSFFSFRASA